LFEVFFKMRTMGKLCGLRRETDTSN